MEVTPGPKERKEVWQRTCSELVEELGMKSRLSQGEKGVLLGKFSIFLLHIVMEEQTNSNKISKYRKGIKVLEISSFSSCNFFLVPVDVTIGLGLTLSHFAVSCLNGLFSPK